MPKTVKKSKARLFATFEPLSAVVLAALANLPAARAAQLEPAGSSYNNLVVNTGVVMSLLFAVILCFSLTASRSLRPGRWVVVTLAGSLALTLFTQDIPWSLALSYPMVQPALIALALAVVVTIFHVFSPCARCTAVVSSHDYESVMMPFGRCRLCAYSWVCPSLCVNQQWYPFVYSS